ncbi:hypothetical protein PENTCL1PPCAC_19328, partial [Pristionchus entomophagus]
LWRKRAKKIIPMLRFVFLASFAALVAAFFYFYSSISTAHDSAYHNCIICVIATSVSAMLYFAFDYATHYAHFRILLLLGNYPMGIMDHLWYNYFPVSKKFVPIYCSFLQLIIRSTFNVEFQMRTTSWYDVDPELHLFIKLFNFLIAMEYVVLGLLIERDLHRHPWEQTEYMWLWAVVPEAIFFLNLAVVASVCGLRRKEPRLPLNKQISFSSALGIFAILSIIAVEISIAAHFCLARHPIHAAFLLLIVNSLTSTIFIFDKCRKSMVQYYKKLLILFVGLALYVVAYWIWRNYDGPELKLSKQIRSRHCHYAVSGGCIILRRSVDLRSEHFIL